MANTRNAGSPKVKADSIALLELSQSAREGKALGIGLCGLNPSGCYDIAKGIGLNLHNVPFVRVQSAYDPKIDPMLASLASAMGASIPMIYQFLEPPQFNIKCDTVFFTGCGMDSSSMPSILNSLSQKYQFTNIRYVYQIAPPHHPESMAYYQDESEDALLSFENSPYRFRLLYSGVDTRDPSNIGMPRLVSKESEYKVPLKCYGIIRHRDIDDFHPGKNNKCSAKVEKYLNEYFRQVADAGKDCVTKPITIIAIGITPPNRQRILEIAQLYSVSIDFCDQYPDYRLPHQNDFFHALSVMKDRKGIVSFDGTSTQSLLQAISLGSSPIVFNPDTCWLDFYAQLVSLVPVEYQSTAQVILGLSDNYELFKDREKCQKVYDLLHLEISKAHNKFDNFREANLALMKAATSGHADVVAKEVTSQNVNCARADGWTPFMLAAEMGHVEVLNILRQNGANTNQGLPNGMTSFMIAVANGRIEAVKLLIPQEDTKDFVNKTRTDGWTPLMLAAEKGHIDILNLLLQHGADVNKALPNGMTASMIAEANGHANIVKILLLQKDVNANKQLSQDAAHIACPDMKSIVTDSESKLSLSFASPNNSFFPALQEANKTSSATVVQLHSAATTVKNPQCEDAESVRLFFQRFGECSKRSYWYGKNVKDITLTQIVDHAKGKNKKSIFQQGKSHGGSTTEDILIKHFDVDIKDISSENINKIREQILKNKRPENRSRTWKFGSNHPFR